MVYKDKDKQKQASKKAMQRLRAKNKESALTGQKQPSENARGLTTMDEVGVNPVNPPVNPVIPKRAEVLANRSLSFQGTAKPGNENYPEQTGLNICDVCGCKLDWDVLDICLACVDKSPNVTLTAKQVKKVWDALPDNNLPDTLLPACVPKILHARYAREPEYAKVIDKLLNHSLDELRLQAVWIPVWRHAAGPAAPLTASPVAEKAKRQKQGAGGRG